ncbi:MAG: flavin reductase family protein [Syntrophobacterales bacterium]|nr:flavin reductase family protein [Syntrophobacterales bacterium]
MKKISAGTNVFIYPMPVVLVGANVGEKANFMAVGWVSRVNAAPPMLAVGIFNKHYTNEGIRENGTFSVCFPDRKLVEKADYCGIVSGRKTDKSKLFDVFYGETKTAPMIGECPLNLECRLVQTVELPTNNLYIGEIVASFADERCLTEGKLDVKKLDPLLLTMPDNRYWAVGEFAGNAWEAGKGLRQG